LLGQDEISGFYLAQYSDGIAILRVVKGMSNVLKESSFFKEEVGGDLILADSITWVTDRNQMTPEIFEFALVSKNIFVRYRAFHLNSSNLEMIIPDWDHPTNKIEMEDIYNYLRIEPETLPSRSSSSSSDSSDNSSGSSGSEKVDDDSSEDDNDSGNDEENQEEVIPEEVVKIYPPVTNLKCSNTHALVQTRDYYIVIPLAKQNG
jgi:hypothetical protein